MSRRRRQVQLLIVSLVFGLLALFILFIGIAVSGIPARAEPPTVSTPQPRQTLPQKCQEHYGKGNDLWIECMGVGRK